MKIVYCQTCEDIFTPALTKTTCSCESTVARYLEDGKTVKVSGPNAVVMGVLQSELRRVVTDHKLHGKGGIIKMFIILDTSRTVRRVQV